MRKGIILALGLTALGCNKSSGYTYVCFTPLGVIPADNAEVVGSTLIIDNEDKTIKVPFSSCIGIKEKK